MSQKPSLVSGIAAGVHIAWRCLAAKVSQSYTVSQPMTDGISRVAGAKMRLSKEIALGRSASAVVYDCGRIRAVYFNTC